MILNGKPVNTQVFADYTRISPQATARFWHLDRIMYAMSPYLTQDETYKIMDAMEKMAKGKIENNWSPSDAVMFCRETIGNDRWNAMEQMWVIQNQNAVQSLYSPDELREAWVHKVGMTEATVEELTANPQDYILIKVPKDRNVL